MKTKTIHLILNAHIDPIWLWPWEAGFDEVLATCRSACDRLDAHPDIIFTRGEAWVYRQIELVDHELYTRIRKHIEAGRWEPVGWWIQPDCNAPSGWAMEKQIELGKAYFQDSFGFAPRIGYNVDSFGHAATLPGYLRAAGQDCYIMLRPQEHEKTLPARLFRWRGYEDGPEVVTFRIAWGYMTYPNMHISHFQQALTDLPEGIEDTMAFVGVGDHGGGPTEIQIAWCREHAHDIEGWKLKFSSPSRFFKAIEDKRESLPLVTGELQMHAVGCYSVYRPLKTQLRRAEHMMAQADFAAADPVAVPFLVSRLKEAWQDVCFHQFHDTLGGTCIPSAYVATADQLGFSATTANKLITYTLRRKLTTLPDDPLQRIALWNPSKNEFKGYVEFEPWLERNRSAADGGLLDDKGNAVEHQVIEQEAASDGLLRILFPMKLEAGELATVRLLLHGAKKVEPRVSGTTQCISNDLGVKVTADALEFGAGVTVARPSLHLIEDLSDTWSHDTDRFSEDVLSKPVWNPAELVDSGPLMASWIEKGAFGSKSEVTAEWRVYAGEPFVGLDLKIDLREKHTMLKLTIPLADKPALRVDGIMGGALERPNDAREVPVRDWCHIGSLGVVCPDVYALDASPDRLRLTLLRSPLMAHHLPHPPTQARPTYADQGFHHFRFRIYAGKGVSQEGLNLSALAMERPPICATLTRGMPSLPGYDS